MARTTRRQKWLWQVTILAGFVATCRSSQRPIADTSTPQSSGIRESGWKINWAAVEDAGLSDIYSDERITRDTMLGADKKKSGSTKNVSIACVITRANQANLREFLHTTMIGLEATGLKRFGKAWPSKREQIQFVLFIDGSTLSSMEKMMAPQMLTDRANLTLRDLSESLKSRRYPRSFNELRSRLRIIVLDSTDQLAQFYVSGGSRGVAFGIIDAHGGFAQWGTRPWNKVSDSKGLAHLVNNVLKQLQ